MSEENTAETPDSSQSDASKPSAKRQRSSIAFPYLDLEEAIGIAGGIHANVGSGVCSDHQLAPWLKQSANSSAFRIRISVARLFGLIEGEYDAMRLTELGRKVVDPKTEAQARAEAFLNVPLYRAVYEKMRGGVIPPPAAFERELVALGVAETQKDRARQALERSAEQAGFHKEGRNRLVMPGFVQSNEPLSPEDKLTNNGGGGGGSSGGGDGTPLALDPLLMALLQKIPPKEEGWPGAKRIRWFRTFAMNVSQVYDNDDAPVELKIDMSVADNG